MCVYLRNCARGSLNFVCFFMAAQNQWVLVCLHSNKTLFSLNSSSGPGLYLYACVCVCVRACVCARESVCECVCASVCKVADIRCRWFPVASLWQATSSCLPGCTSLPRLSHSEWWQGWRSFLPRHNTSHFKVQKYVWNPSGPNLKVVVSFTGDRCSCFPNNCYLTD